MSKFSEVVERLKAICVEVGRESQEPEVKVYARIQPKTCYEMIAILDAVVEMEEALRDIANFEYSACVPEYCINRAHKALASVERLCKEDGK